MPHRRGNGLCSENIYYTFYGYWVFFQVEAFQFSKFHEDMSKLDKSNLKETWAWHSRFQKVLNSRKVCWNNFLTSQWLILLYYFYQKILKEKTAILENIVHIFFTFFGITIYLYIKKHVCIIYAWIMHCWIMNRIVYHELAQPF